MPRGKLLSEGARKIIINYHKQGKSAYKIAKETNISRSTVRDIIKLFESTGSVASRKKPGRPPCTNNADRRALRKIVKNNRFATFSSINLEWQSTIQKELSVDTCKRVLKKMGYASYKAKEKPLLTALQKRKRLEFAKEHQHWTLRQWHLVIWSDESRFEISVGGTGKRVIRTSIEAFNPSCVRRSVKFPSAVTIWGCMSARGVGHLHLVDGTINAERCQTILENNLLPSIPSLQSPEGKYIFQQDGASCHSARSTKSWLESRNIPLMYWPSNSPDLSPIESLWGVMKKKFRQNPARNLNSLKIKIKDIWKSITREECEALVSSMPRRLTAVIEAKGDATKW